MRPHVVSCTALSCLSKLDLYTLDVASCAIDTACIRAWARGGFDEHFAACAGRPLKHRRQPCVWCSSCSCSNFSNPASRCDPDTHAACGCQWHAHGSGQDVTGCNAHRRRPSLTCWHLAQSKFGWYGKNPCLKCVAWRLYFGLFGLLTKGGVLYRS